ncbi:cysteine-rich repeat secretory protein 55 isoform X2 [Vigna radiata var. radiata]|uniref:Cysteine-rich repeat secretory protein 55 isoform X2 n=1 Tax=Vigna radiata var. radiata TaxID=3916 RepID=A0A1S3TUL5_VIGRR|nr:cysteine-rich repeat secretory protein 55 isoform X2 [Vigna radiata var. radiata]
MMHFSHRPMFLLFLCIWGAKAADPLGEFCNRNTNISNGGKLSANIDKLLAELALKTPSTGFVATTYGKDQDKVYALSQCRGDVSTEDCSTCIQDATKQIRQRCPNQADARIWYDYCFLRFDNKSFFELGALMNHIRAQAVVPKEEGLGKGKSVLSPFVTLYALVQCTRDLSDISCAQCLAVAVNNFPNFCSNRKGCRVLYSSCYVRYEIYPFFFPLDSNKTGTSNAVRVSVYT